MVPVRPGMDVAATSTKGKKRVNLPLIGRPLHHAVCVLKGPRPAGGNA